MGEDGDRRERRHRIEVPPMIVTSASQSAQSILISILTAFAGADLDNMKGYIKPGLVMNKGIATSFPELAIDRIPEFMEDDIEFRYKEIIDLIKKGIAQGVGSIHASLWESFIGTSYRLQMYTALMNQIAVAPYISRYFNRQCRPTLPDEATLIALRRLYIIKDADYFTLMSYLGWSDANAELAYKSEQRPIDIDRAIELYWRGIYNVDSVKWVLRLNRIRDEDFDAFLALTELIPPAPDLIQMVVREAFDPKQVVPAPPIFAEFMGKKGYKQPWPDRYWTAHFFRAAIGRIEERYRRGELSESELRAWYTLADIHPGDHDHLLGTIYSAPTRLDMRQGYAAGVYVHEDLVKFNTWRGLSPGDAEMAARSIELYLLRDEVTAMAKAAEEDLLDGLIDEATLRANLAALRFTPEEIEYRVAVAIHKLERKIGKIVPTVSTDYLKDEVARMAAEGETDFVEDLIDESTFRADLTALGFKPEEINYRVSLALHKRDREVRKEAMAAAKAQYLYAKISEEEFRQQLLALGVSMTRVDLLIRELSVRRKQTGTEVKTEKKKRLSEAKVATARDLGLISDGEYVRRLMDIDYTDDDANLMLQIELTPRPVTPQELERRQKTVTSRLNRAKRRFELQLTRLKAEIEAVSRERDDTEYIAKESLDVFDMQIGILEREIAEQTPLELLSKIYLRTLTLEDVLRMNLTDVARRLWEEVFSKPELAALLPEPVKTRLNSWKTLRERREFAAASWDKRLKALVDRKTDLEGIYAVIEKQRDEEISEYEEELKLVGAA